MCQRLPGNSHSFGLRRDLAVDAKFLQQLRAEHDIAVLPPLPSRIWTTIRLLSMSLTFR